MKYVQIIVWKLFVVMLKPEEGFVYSVTLKCVFNKKIPGNKQSFEICPVNCVQDIPKWDCHNVTNQTR